MNKKIFHYEKVIAYLEEKLKLAEENLEQAQQ